MRRTDSRSLVQSTLIGAYWGVLVIMLIGQSLLLSIARKPETKVSSSQGELEGGTWDRS